MRAVTGQVVGDVTLVGDPASVALAIPDWMALVRSYGGTVDAPYWVMVQEVDGTRETHRLPPPDEPWRFDVDADVESVAIVSIVDNGGVVWCSAQFTA